MAKVMRAVRGCTKSASLPSRHHTHSDLRPWDVLVEVKAARDLRLGYRRCPISDKPLFDGSRCRLDAVARIRPQAPRVAVVRVGSS